MKSYIEHEVTLYATLKSAFRPNQKVHGPPNLPLELERHIFEMCALDNLEVCTVLVRVARRVHLWLVVVITCIYSCCFSHVNTT